MSRLFDGTNDRLDRANFWNATGAFTLSFWVYRTKTTANLYYFVTHNSGDAVVGGQGFIVWDGAYTNAIELRVYRSTTDTIRISASGSIPANTWVQVVVTYDGNTSAAGAIVYINGSASSLTSTNGSGSQTAAVGSHSIAGRIFDNNRNFGGRIAEFGLWPGVVLDSTTIAGLAAGNAPSFYPTNLGLYLPLVSDDGDDSGNGRDFTAVNGPTFDTHPPGIVYPGGSGVTASTRRRRSWFGAGPLAHSR